MAGLPNITGKYKADMLTYKIGTINTGTGALYSYTADTKYYAQGASGDSYGMGLDASRSSSIYGSSTTVTPLSESVVFYIKH